MGVQIPRPTYKDFCYCTRCGVKDGWYLRKNSEWPNGGVEAEYDGDGRPRCPVHGGLLRTTPRNKNSRESFIEAKGYTEAREDA